MPENELDSGQAAGTTSSPNGASSGGVGDKPSSFDAAKLQSTLEALTKKLDEVDKRSAALQGDKDRGVNQTKEEVKELKRKIAEIEKLKKSGLDEDSAVDEFSFREDVRSLKDQLAKLNPTSTQPAGNGASGAVNAAKVFENLGLPADNPEVAAMRMKSYSNDVDAYVDAAKFLERQRAKPTPSDADKPVPQATPAPDVKLTEESYKKEMRAAPRGPKGDAERAAVQKKYTEGGVNINVDLG